MQDIYQEKRNDRLILI